MTESESISLTELFNKCSINDKPNNKGKLCSIMGKSYELKIYNIVKMCKLNNNQFNTQSINELGGCSNKNDIICNFNDTNNIGIEIKKYKSPDWMQCSLKHHYINNKWIGSSRNIIPEKSKKIFEDIISSKILFNGKIPPFMIKI